MRVIQILRSVWRISWQDRLLLLEAILWLGVAGIAITLLPFRHVGRFAARPIRQPLPRDARLEKIRRIRWAITTTAARVPWRALCFQQGLAAQLMLRLTRYSFGALLRRGARRSKWIVRACLGT